MTHTPWINFLQTRGFTIADAQISSTTVAKGQPCLYDLSSLGVLSCSGDDAAAFLQSQLSNDMSALSNERASQLSAYCTPKGRMLALFIVIKTQQAYALIAPQAVLDKVQKRLQMFVMRAQVRFELAEDIGLLGVQFGESDADALLEQCQKREITVYPYPNSNRSLLFGPYGALISLADHYASTPLTDQQAWQSANIAEGLPQLHEPLIEELIPQSLNLDLVNGINFKKGCYPGQEIIARIKYRGKPKTRMISASIGENHRPELCTPVFITGRLQRAGVVVNIGKPQNGQTPMQITIPVSALSEGDLCLASTDGPQLKRENLPYAILV